METAMFRKSRSYSSIAELKVFLARTLTSDQVGKHILHIEALARQPSADGQVNW